MEPVVYQTGELPQMDQLTDVPTRPLDAFEAASLPKLRAASDLQYQATDEGIHMLGAIRAANTCLQCHAASRGELLGAFSYRIER